MTFNGSQAYGSEKILNCFADYFQSVYNNPVSNNNKTSLASTVNVNITDITEEEILDALTALDSKSTNGPDRIPSVFLKDFVQEFYVTSVLHLQLGAEIRYVSRFLENCENYSCIQKRRSSGN
jgi:hypothetical protein